MPSTFVAIVIGLLMLLGSLLSYGIATAFIVQLGARLVRSGYAGVSFWKNVGVMTAVFARLRRPHILSRSRCGRSSFCWSARFRPLTKHSTFRRKTTRRSAMETSFSRRNGGCWVRLRPLTGCSCLGCQQP